MPRVKFFMNMHYTSELAKISGSLAQCVLPSLSPILPVKRAFFPPAVAECKIQGGHLVIRVFSVSLQGLYFTV